MTSQHTLITSFIISMLLDDMKLTNITNVEQKKIFYWFHLSCWYLLCHIVTL